MKILIITQYYPPENTLISPTLARMLSEKRHEVRVLTGYPNYPDGRLFAGYSQRWRSYEIDGLVNVLRVPLWPDHSQSPVRRALNYASFALSASTARSFARGADVIYVYATQMTPAFAPWIWRLTGGAPYILHVQDLWPDSITGSTLVKQGWASRLADSILSPWILSVYAHAGAVIAIAPTMVKTLLERGVDSRRVHLIFNWAEEESLQRWSGALSSDSTARVTHILYGGNIGDMQDLETAVLAAHEASDAGIQLTIVGDGVALPRIRHLVDEVGISNVNFKGRVPRSRMGELYQDAHYSLITLKDLPVFNGTIPSKFQASLSHGIPVITTVQGDVRALVEEFSVGFTADAESVASLALAFRRAAQIDDSDRRQLAERARSVYKDRFSQTAGIDAVEKILVDATRLTGGS